MTHPLIPTFVAWHAHIHTVRKDKVQHNLLLLCSSVNSERENRNLEGQIQPGELWRRLTQLPSEQLLARRPTKLERAEPKLPQLNQFD